MKRWLLTGAVLAALATLIWFAGEPALRAARRMAGLDTAPPGVVATVDGAPILLREVEAVSDMNAPTLASAQPATFEELRAEYAASLNMLIAQALVRRELDQRGIAVADEDVLALERTVSSGYKTAPGEDFNPYIEENGLPPDLWREQLRARLELERWQEELLRDAPVSLRDVETYIAAHPEARSVPGEVSYLLVSGAKKAALEQAVKEQIARQQTARTRPQNAGEENGGTWNLEALRAQGLEASFQRRALPGPADIWREDLASLRPGQASPPRQTDTAWRCVILLERKESRTLPPVELYVRVERLLAEKKLPELYDAWLAKAVARADIRIAAQLLPRNVTKPAPRLTPAPAIDPLRPTPEEYAPGGADDLEDGEPHNADTATISPMDSDDEP